MAEVYLDNNATTRPLPEVRDAIFKTLGDAFGNPSSVHEAGHRAREQLRNAREAVANLVAAPHDQVFCTGSGTEANAMALWAAAESAGTPRIVTTSVEHSSVLKACEQLATRGAAIDIRPVDSNGLIDLENLERALSQPAALVSVQWVNNETGVVQPIDAIGRLCRLHGVAFHTDAAQAVGKLPINVQEMPVDCLTLTAHKLHGPQGVGAVFARSDDLLYPFFTGSQEGGLRAGTENMPGIVGFGTAAALRRQRFDEVCRRLETLRDRFEEQIFAALPNVTVNGSRSQRVCNTSNLCFQAVDGQALVVRLDQQGIRCSQSSACTNRRPEPSYVLRAMGLSEEAAYSSVRFGFSELNTDDEADFAVEKIVEICRQLRQFRRRVHPAATPPLETR